MKVLRYVDEGFLKSGIGGKTSNSLDCIRACAAVVVMLGHLRAFFFVSYNEVQYPTAFITIAYFLTGLAHQAVIVFFVLSGFFISVSVLKAFKECRWSWKWYLNQRLTRLWVVLIPALILGAFWDQLGMWLFETGKVYQGLPSDRFILPFSVAERSNWITLLGCLFFLQEIFVVSFGSNAPLWSLSYEFWYYMMFPCLVLALIVTSRKTKVCWMMSFLLLSIFVGQGITLYFIIWLLGLCVMLVPPLPTTKARYSRLIFAVAFILFLMSLVAVRSISNPILADVCVAVTFTILLYTILHSDNDKELYGGGSKPRPFSLFGRVAGFSYTLYLVHLPPLLFLHAWLYGRTGVKWQPDLSHTAQGAMIGLIILVYAWLVSSVTETRTSEIRQSMARILELRPRELLAPLHLADMHSVDD